jgi:cyclic-di-GMP phosphodiesterase TipF (flagellum assembly factor)
MLRLTAIFVAICVVLIAGSAGAIGYLFFGLSGAEAAIIALAVMMALAIYNTVSGRLRGRGLVGDQIADLSRGTADLARQVGELGRRLAAVEGQAANPRRKEAKPDTLAAELEELGTLVKQLAETVAAHDAVLMDGGRSMPRPAAEAPGAEPASPTPATAAAVSDVPTSGPFKGLEREAVVALIAAAIDASRVDLYLQPIVTLPQRKVRYYEALTRLRTEDGTLLLPEDYQAYAEAAGLVPKIDNLLLFRSVQVLRRLLVKNREVGLFCNLSVTTLNDTAIFPEISQFLDANRVLAPSLVLEFTQAAWRSMGPIETAGLDALAELGFRFAMDKVDDLRLDPREVAERSIRFIKVPADALIGRSGSPGADIHAADLSDLLGRFGVSLIADRVEKEATVVDLLDYDVRFAQGMLFSPPRPVRPEALQASGARAGAEGAGTTAKPADGQSSASAERASALAKIAQQAGRI